jgi:16S rRNA (guanine966-N2)-methyltransferase
MRIITGSARGRPLVVPKGELVRPTADRVRESLFSALGPGRCVGARVLDLYAGSGALGLEAASRGALATVLVERDRSAAAAITTNIERTGVAARLAHQDVVSFLRAPAPEAPFDLVFMDPPYELAPDAHSAALERLAAPGWCDDAVTVVCEIPADVELPASDSWRVHWERRFGGTLVAFLSKEP